MVLVVGDVAGVAVRIFPGVWANVSQIDSPLPSSFHAPSTWYDEVATPQRNPSGKRRTEEAAASDPTAFIHAPPSLSMPTEREPTPNRIAASKPSAAAQRL